jgi:hypothetical protein
MGRQQDLVDLGPTLDPAGLLAGLGQRRQQNADEQRDDGHHHEQLNKRERKAGLLTHDETPHVQLLRLQRTAKKAHSGRTDCGSFIRLIDQAGGGEGPRPC